MFEYHNIDDFLPEKFSLGIHSSEKFLAYYTPPDTQTDYIKEYETDIDKLNLTTPIFTP